MWFCFQIFSFLLTKKDTGEKFQLHLKNLSREIVILKNENARLEIKVKMKFVFSLK